MNTISALWPFAGVYTTFNPKGPGSASLFLRECIPSVELLAWARVEADTPWSLVWYVDVVEEFTEFAGAPRESAGSADRNRDVSLGAFDLNVEILRNYYMRSVKFS